MRTALTLLVVALAATLLAACDSAPAPADGGANHAAAHTPAPSPEPSTAAARPDAAASPTRPRVRTFTVKVSLSDAAAAQFDRSGETVIVSASYFGIPKPDTPKSDIDDIGQVDLGDITKELPGAGSAVFVGSAVPPGKLAFISGRPQVNINVFSGRHSSSDNLLGCDMFQGSVDFAAEKPLELHCALLTEEYQTKAVVEPSSGTSR